MADLKTTQDRRERFVTWLHMPGEDRYSIRAWCVAEDACDDVDTLLAENAVLRKQAWDDAGGERAEWCGRVLALEAENAKLRAVAEAAKAAVDMVDEEEPRDALRRALYALGEP